MDSDDYETTTPVVEETVEEIFIAYLEADKNPLNEESGDPEEPSASAPAMRMTTRIKTYLSAMKCAACGLIPIPPLYSCSSNHWYCRICSETHVNCIYQYQDGEKCPKILEIYKDKLYEAIFGHSEFSCPWKKHGCTDRFRGKVIMKGDVVWNCKYKTPQIVEKDSGTENPSTEKLDPQQPPAEEPQPSTSSQTFQP